MAQRKNAPTVRKTKTPFSETGRIERHLYLYAAVIFGFAVSIAIGTLHFGTMNFWLTALASFFIVTVFDFLVLEPLEHGTEVSIFQLLLRMMVVVVVLQYSFACVYYFGADATSHLIHSHSGDRVTDFVDAVYFSAVTLFTVGYGDILPAGDFRFTVAAEIYGSSLFVFSFFSWGLSLFAARRLEEDAE